MASRGPTSAEEGRHRELVWKNIAKQTLTDAFGQVSPLAWAVDVSHAIRTAGLEIPSIELAVLLTELATSCPNLSIWSFLDHAMASQLVSSFHVLSLLIHRVWLNRVQSPEMYSMFIELSSNHVFALWFTNSLPCCNRVVRAVDEALQISASYGTSVTKLGMAIVYFVFTLVSKLIEATCEDWSVSPSHSDKKGKVGGLPPLQSHYTQASQVEHMEVEHIDKEWGEESDGIRKNNSLAALGLLTRIMQDKKMAALIRLARRHFSEQWSSFERHLKVLESLMLSAPYLEAVKQLCGSLWQALHEEWNPAQHPTLKIFLETNSRITSFGSMSAVGRSAGWLPLDIFMENAMDGRRVPHTSTIEHLADLVKSLQVIQKASWHETFLALWMAGLRLVQRERETIEGPRPRVEARLCMLLSVVPLASAMLVEEEEKEATGASKLGTLGGGGKSVRRGALATSLQILGQFSGLIYAPHYVVEAAQQAALVAVASCKQVNGGNGGSGNMWHLIVETCKARDLLDVSAYSWPGYIGNGLGSFTCSASSQGWAEFMNGAPLSSDPLKTSLMNFPARSLAELEKVYHIASNGKEEERVKAVGIICGMTLTRGWNIQEHVVRLVVRLLSPVSSDPKGGSEHLLSCAPVIAAVLKGITSMGALNVLLLHGMFPELAAALMPICEVFGSVSPAQPLPSIPGEEISVLKIFSLAFLLLLRISKFHSAPVEHRLLGSGAALGSGLSLEHLLMRRNNQVEINLKSLKGSAMHACNPINLDSFPKIKAWYCQYHACIASPLSGLGYEGPRQVANSLVQMMMSANQKCKSSGSGSISGATSSAAGDDLDRRPVLPAWDILAAVPFAVDDVLRACAHQELTPRELTQGLKELKDFLPASFAIIVSYFAAEVTRGLWEPASMNGSLWPTPGSNLRYIETAIRDMLSAAGVSIPSLHSSTLDTSVALPLPLAALVALTITYTVDKTSEVDLGVAGPAMEVCTGGSPLSRSLIVAALWATKVEKWNDHIIFGAAHAVFNQNKDAVKQLLRSCFTATVGLTNTKFPKLTVQGGVGALLGRGVRSPPLASTKVRHPVPPGMLYILTCPALHDIKFVAGEILGLVVKTTSELSSAGGLQSENSFKQISSLQPSLATVVAKLRQASMLGASLLCVSGETPLVELLYKETLPNWFLSGDKGSSNALLEGFALAYFVFLAGAIVWGVSEIKANPILFQRREHAVSIHLEFLARVFDGSISFNCPHSVWRAYVLAFISLLVNCAPHWILDAEVDTVQRLAFGLRGWHENHLAIALVQKRGPDALSLSVQLIFE